MTPLTRVTSSSPQTSLRFLWQPLKTQHITWQPKKKQRQSRLLDVLAWLSQVCAARDYGTWGAFHRLSPTFKATGANLEWIGFSMCLSINNKINYNHIVYIYKSKIHLKIYFITVIFYTSSYILMNHLFIHHFIHSQKDNCKKGKIYKQGNCKRMNEGINVIHAGFLGFTF